MIFEVKPGRGWEGGEDYTKDLQKFIFFLEIINFVRQKKIFFWGGLPFPQIEPSLSLDNGPGSVSHAHYYDILSSIYLEVSGLLLVCVLKSFLK